MLNLMRMVCRKTSPHFRRLQVVCFSPLAMLNAWSSGRKPWSFPEVIDIVRKYMKLRMRLLPYFYSAFSCYHFDRTPPFRAMALEVKGHLADDQYMAGDSMLIAPLFAGETSREVFLPAGDWYDFETGERLEGGQVVRVSPGLETIPVFVRDGGIIPLMPPYPHVPSMGDPIPLEIRHYGKASGQFRLFDDDGETFAYESGNYQWRVVEVDIDAGGAYRGQISGVEGDWRSAYGQVQWIFAYGTENANTQDSF